MTYFKKKKNISQDGTFKEIYFFMFTIGKLIISYIKIIKRTRELQLYISCSNPRGPITKNTSSSDTRGIYSP